MADEKEQKKATDPAKIAKIITLVLAVMNIAVCGGGAALVYMATLGSHVEPVTEEHEKENLKTERGIASEKPLMFTMEPFTVNLDGFPKRTIRLGISLEMLDESGFEEVVRLGPGARDEIVRLLNGKNFSEVETIQGKLFLKNQIAISLNHFLKEGVVSNVYFNDFVVQ